MATLIDVPVPQKGGDPRKLWQITAALIKKLNDLSITIITSDGSKQAKISDGDIEIDLTNLVTFSDLSNLVPGAAGDDSQQQSGGTDLNTGATSS